MLTFCFISSVTGCFSIGSFGLFEYELYHLSNSFTSFPVLEKGLKFSYGHLYIKFGKKDLCLLNWCIFLEYNKLYFIFS